MLNLKIVASISVMLLLASCSMKRYRIKGNSYTKPMCERSYNGLLRDKVDNKTVFKSEKGCRSSTSYNVAINKYKQEEYYKVIRVLNVVECFTQSKLDLLEIKSDYRGKRVYEKSYECLDSKEAKKQKTVGERWRKREISKFVNKHPKYRAYKDIALKKKIVIGMPAYLLFLSWGKADKKNSHVTSGSKVVQHVYFHYYVYLKNDIVTSWQRFE